MKTLEEKAKHAACVRRWYASNPVRAAEIAKRSRNKNIVNRRASEIAYRELPSSRAAALNRATAWRLANPERYKANMERAAMKNAVKARARSAKWKRDNPERAKVNAIEYQHRRRVRMNGNGAIDQACKTFVRVVKLVDSYSCVYCLERHVGVPEVDHAVPIARGGTHTMDNLVLSCKLCNASKGARTPEEFAAYKIRRIAA